MLKPIVLMISNIVEKPLHSGEKIVNRYEIIRHLGSGSYGHSYLVLDSNTQSQVVLKALRWHKRITNSGRIGFQKEINMLKEIHHPSFPAYLESGYVGKIPFFTMEYIDGKTFEQLIFNDDKQFGEREAFTLGYELLEIIDSLQQANIVHRDIRIPNIMWDGKTIKVIDLGLARRVSEKESIKYTKISHPRKQIDVKSDFYGLGHFLLFLLYSNFSPSEDGKERSWEEELSISGQGKRVLRKLLQIDPPYEVCDELKLDIQKIISSEEG
ncbi:serine/threonine protein kinase [Neobacillus sp. LXY-4]|uniref:serine/threonine protein kinase n=1 Tax=Neobacillus sp. LXY-4 TaxID=3379826 RepID=UPI003EE1B18B